MARDRRDNWVDERASDRGPQHRHRTPWLLKWWPVIASLIVFSAGGATFYFSAIETTKNLADLTVQHQHDIAESKQERDDHARYATATYATRAEVNLQLEIRDGLIGSLRDIVKENKEGNDTNYARLDKKVDRMIDLLNQVLQQRRNDG